MMASLNGRTVLITGAARGIGAATARRLASEGARLVLADQDGAGVEKLAAELKQVAVKADVTRPDDIARMVDEPYKRWGRLDVLFNNAGVIRVEPMFDVTEAEWDRVMDVNLRAVFFVLQAVAKRMVKQDVMPGSELRGKLIQTASIASYRGGNHLMTPYSASKEWGALEGLGQGEAWKRRIRHIPLGRPERAEDVAGIVAFLAGPDSDYMTGQAINVDGGIVMGS